LNFKKELDNIVSKSDGALAAVLMGFDGIVVAEARGKGVSESLNEISIEYSRIIKEAIKVSQGNDLGELNELVVNTSHHRFVFRVVNADYFVGLLLKSGAITGRGRFQLRKAASVIHRGL